MAEGNACFRRNMHRKRGGGHTVTIVGRRRSFGVSFRSRVHANASHIYVAFGGSPISESNK